MGEPTVRNGTDDELEDLINVVRTSFLSGPISAEELEFRRSHIHLDRFLGAWDGDGRPCGTARSFPTPLTVPGGEVAAAAVSGVGVLPTHRRQGHLTRLMDAQLADAAQRGEPVAILIAAEYPIYGRFGYGPATEATRLQLDAIGARWRDEPVGTVELVDNETYAKVAEELYDRVRRATPGHIGWDTVYWRLTAGIDPGDDEELLRYARAYKALWRDERGEVQGVTQYDVAESWEHNRPANTVQALHVVAATARAEHELLRYLASIDWIRDVKVFLRPTDDPARLALVDGRMAVLADRSDHIWLRVLDVPAALGARRYAAAGAVVIEVDDPRGYAAGRFRLEADAAGAASCTPTDATPDLSVPASALGAAYLGGLTWARLADAGWVDEHTPGAVARASLLFSGSRAPWCARSF